MKRMLVARLAGVAVSVSAAGTIAEATPASADEQQYWIAGDFFDSYAGTPSPGDELLEYNPGVGGEVLYRPERVGTETDRHIALGEMSIQQVDAWYSPMTGDFNGDGFDDIFWNASGSTPDWIWTSNGNGTFANHSSVQIPGLQYTVTGDFTNDGADDILYHGPGPSVPDGLYDFAPHATLSTPTHTAKAISGSYIPLAGNFMSTPGDEVYWYGPSADESVWTFNGGPGHTSVLPSHNVDLAYYKPVVTNTQNDAYDDILWYLPGTGIDYLWDFRNGSVTPEEAQAPIQLNSTYTWTVGGDFMGEGHGDVLLDGPTTTRMLDWYVKTDGSVGVHNHDLGAEP